MRSLFSTLLFIFSVSLSVRSALNSTNSNTNTCNPSHNGLATGTLQFNSDCNATTWCDNGQCRAKGCRKDRFPLGYDTSGSHGSGKDITPPPLCPDKEFCPDEGSQCMPKIAVGQPCQFDRDDSCQAPSDFKNLKETTGLGRNVNGSVCLNFVCQFANVSAGSQCEIENTGYVGYGPGGEFVYVVSRDNCKIGFYCDTNSTKCIQEKALGASCSADKECSSYNCLPSRVCGLLTSKPHHFATWVYLVIGVGIFGGIIGTLCLLFSIHGRQRENEREKRLQYWREQNAFRQNILQMHETAQASIFQPGNSSRLSPQFGTLTEDSHAPILQYDAATAAGLRPYGGGGGGDDLSYEDDSEHLVMRTPFTHDNKI